MTYTRLFFRTLCTIASKTHWSRLLLVLGWSNLLIIWRTWRKEKVRVTPFHIWDDPLLLLIYYAHPTLPLICECGVGYGLCFRNAFTYQWHLKGFECDRYLYKFTALLSAFVGIPKHTFHISACSTEDKLCLDCNSVRCHRKVRLKMLALRSSILFILKFSILPMEPKGRLYLDSDNLFGIF